MRRSGQAAKIAAVRRTCRRHLRPDDFSATAFNNTSAFDTQS